MRAPTCLALLVLAVPGIAGTTAPRSNVAESPRLYDVLSDRVAAAYDSARGGFVGRDGVPSDAAVELALRRAADMKSSAWRERAIETVAWSAGLIDSTGGGYHHSAASADRSSATYEKRTDSNARRLENLLLAWRLTDDAAHRQTALRVVDFMERVPFDARGGFAAGQFGFGELIPEVNGVATHAWLEWAAATRTPRRRDEALLTLDRMWAERWNKEHGFLRAEPEKTPAPLLVDQIEMGRAYALAATVGGRDRDLKRAVAVGDLVLERFADEKKGGFRTKAIRKKNGTIAGARALSHENARAARFLCELAGLTGNDRYRLAAGRAWLRFADENKKPSLDAAEWALAVRAAVGHDLTPAPKWEKVAANETPIKRSVKAGKTRK